MNDLSNNLQALLFSEGGSLTKKRLLQLLATDAAQLKAASDALATKLAGSGLALVESDTEFALVVAKESAETVRKAFESDYDREIGDAGLEVLAIILYRGPSTRAQIDYIRGVNTASTIRNLSARGLIERAPNPEDAREYLYRPTVELLSHLGVTGSKELPEYGKITSELAAFEAQAKKESEPFEDHAANESGQ
jgi:segregation and condensation protein B